MIEFLRCHELVYIATPYTLHTQGKEYAYKIACAMIAKLAGYGISAYSPIAHWHTASLLDPQNRLRHLDCDGWQLINKPMMDMSSCLLVPDFSEWEHSRGIHKERLYFHECRKPVFFMESARLKVVPMTWDEAPISGQV